MRKLFNFWRICFYFLFSFSLFMGILFILGILFLLLEYIARKNLFACIVYVVLLLLSRPDKWVIYLSNKAQQISIKVENKIKEIKEMEHNILNADIHERLMNGECGLISKKVSWIKEIIITMIFAAILLFFLHPYIGQIIIIVFYIIGIPFKIANPEY